MFDQIDNNTISARGVTHILIEFKYSIENLIRSDASKIDESLFNDIIRVIDDVQFSEEIDVKSLVQILVDFRYAIRNLVLSNINKMTRDLFNDIMVIMDDIRDNKLKQKGVILQDKKRGEPSVW